MRIRLIFWVVMFTLGLIVGDRYGAPGWAAGVGSRIFSPFEGWIGGFRGHPADEDLLKGNPDEEELYEDEPQAKISDKIAPPAAAPAAPAPAPTSYASVPTDQLTINQAGLDIIKESEGLRLQAYNSGGQWLIGYGHSRDVKAGMTITEAEAERLLRQDVRAFEDGVKSNVTVPMNENQFSAMVSLAYNLGVGGFARTEVVTKINQRDYKGAADAFLKYNKAGGVVNEHLKQRRAKERTLFLTPA